MASSFDQVGTLTKTVYDSALLSQLLIGHDRYDATTLARDDSDDWSQSCGTSIKDMRIALPKQCFEDTCDPRVKKRIETVAQELENKGIEIAYIDMPLIPYAIAAYYTLVPAEVSTNLARYDGIAYGQQQDTYEHESFHNYMTSIRSEYIGPEVKRRILLGSYVLSSEHYE